MTKRKKLLLICAFAFLINLVLFTVKLYIGLTSNSISIFSDAMNNMFDSLSGLITLVCFSLVLKTQDKSLESTIKKSEQFFSFIMALTVAVAGFVFAYSSLERLMYPAPIWYLKKYFVILIFTAMVKLGMFFFYHFAARKVGSMTVKVMAFDSLLDFFFTCVTVLSLHISKSGKYAVDSVLGMVIGVVIVSSAVKMIISSASVLLNYVNKPTRQSLYDFFSSGGVKVNFLSFVTDGERVTAYAKIDYGGDIKQLCQSCEKETGIILNVILT